jgi:hypothetical protein
MLGSETAHRSGAIIRSDRAARTDAAVSTPSNQSMAGLLVTERPTHIQQTAEYSTADSTTMPTMDKYASLLSRKAPLCLAIRRLWPSSL